MIGYGSSSADVESADSVRQQGTHRDQPAFRKRSVTFVQVRARQRTFLLLLSCGMGIP